MMSDFSLLATLWFSAFTSATLLPGTSEAAFAAFLWQRPEAAWAAWLAAGSGNTLGSLTSYWIGCQLPERDQSKLSPRAVSLLLRHGAWLLLLAWLPVAGDALPLAAFERVGMHGSAGSGQVCPLCFDLAGRGVLALIVGYLKTILMRWDRNT